MVLYITMNGTSGTCEHQNAFVLMYRRTNGTSDELIKKGMV